MKSVILDMPVLRAKEWRDSLTAILCWASGYSAANPDGEHNPPGLEDLRHLRTRLSSEISTAERETA